ncbi:MAG TPA: hypothetical protein VG738_01980 [Chitinophagaceae bacterium]|nr:hypothetical protein [Chitinophagaceae bacterium]
MTTPLKHIAGIAFATGIICLAACNNNKAKEEKAVPDSLVSKELSGDDSLQLVHDIDSADYASLFKNKTNVWASTVLADKGIKWTNFALSDFWRDDSIKEMSGYALDKKFLNDYAIFLTWSPDSAYILDRGAYGVTMARDKKGQLYVQDGDVDTEVRLYNPNKNSYAKLFFCGPGTSVWDAHWPDAEQVALLGTVDTSSNHHPDTLLWLINVKDNFFRKYKYSKQ